MSTRLQQAINARPFLKWAGGKSKLISQYISYFPENYTTYYEPFLGGGAVFFHLQPSAAYLSDINPELINAYCCVKDDVETLISLLKIHQLNHSQDYYYKIRRASYHKATQRAARLIYLNKTCYNGLYRENSKGEFNVPIGKYKNPKICNPTLLRDVSAALQTARLEVSSFEEILNKATNPDDFVYFDPPYYPLSSTSNFTEYSRYSFNRETQLKLSKVFAELASRNVKVMLSNSDCHFIRELYKEFKVRSIFASRAINSNAKRRGKISELIITSY
jgi:DNA adenine methylase